LTGLLTLALLSGCASTQPTPGKLEGLPKDVRVVVEPSSQVDLQPPGVLVSDGVMYIQGTARRKAGVTADISGRMSIDFVDRDGKEIDQLDAMLAPDPMPSEGKGESGYGVNYGWIPPEGTTIHFTFLDAKAAALDDLGDSPDEGAGGKRALQSGKGARTPARYTVGTKSSFGRGINQAGMHPSNAKTAGGGHQW